MPCIVEAGLLMVFSTCLVAPNDIGKSHEHAASAGTQFFKYACKHECEDLVSIAQQVLPHSYGMKSTLNPLKLTHSDPEEPSMELSL